MRQEGVVVRITPAARVNVIDIGKSYEHAKDISVVIARI